ncbi:MAG: universal stress protein [Pseudomonadota bacterium]
MSKTLVPVDGSEASCRAAAWAQKNAAATGSSVTLVHVFDMNAAETISMANKTREEIADRIAAHAAPSFDKAKAALSGDDGVETLAVVGNPAEEIIGIALKQNFDHIVIGSRGLTPIKEILLGSVSEKVLNRAHCAVTVVR